MLYLLDFFKQISGETNIGKWGIPEKSYKNVAQQCYLDGCSAFLQDFIAKNRFLEIPPAISPATLKMVTNMGRSWATEKTKCVLKPVKQWEQIENMHKNITGYQRDLLKIRADHATSQFNQTKPDRGLAYRDRS